MPILVRTPLQTFTLVSLGLIMLMVMGVGYVQSIFLRNAILDREGVIVRDVVQAVVSQQISFNDLVRFREPGVQMYFERSFTVLNNLSEVVRMKIYNRHGVLVWSDDPLLIGRRVAGDPEVEHALTGGMESQFYSGEIVEYAEENLPPIPVVEFYVTFFLEKRTGKGLEIGGVFALYRSAQTLNSTINTSAMLVWAVTGLAGLILYAVWLYYRVNISHRDSLAEGS